MSSIPAAPESGCWMRGEAVQRLPAPDHGPSPEGTQIFLHRFQAHPLTVRRALKAASARFRGQISAQEAGTLELVLAEVMNNIVEHSYGRAGRGCITLSILREVRGLSCLVCDEGTPLPPVCLEPPRLPNIDCVLADLPEGGFGWYLIRDLTLDLAYRREEGHNLLAFRLPLQAG